ncbi:MAG: GNAT family N-acetyltransferase [Rhizobium sp.]|nr:GNAT family N-acetyltransferase [Rhizobium sp.]
MTVPNIAVNRESAGLLLRPFEERDAAEFAQAVRESVESVGPWMPWCHAEYSQTDALEWFKTCHHDAAAGTAYEYGVFSKDGNEFLGGAGLNLIVRQHGYCNLGYWVRQSQQRRGVASACVAVLSEVGFRELKLHRIEIVVAVGNEPSAGVARKAGATLECIARNRLLLKGKPVDASVFSLVPAKCAG